MLTAGIDVGTRTIKVVLLKDGQVLGKGIARYGLDIKGVTNQVYQQVLAGAGVSADQVATVMATGIGKTEVPIPHDEVTEITSDAAGVVYVAKSVRTALDVGAEEARVIKCDEQGKVADFAINEKCAAGSGTFIETMARALEIKVEEFGPMSLQSSQTIPMNAQCAVFAESEVVSLIHAKTSKADIARAVHDSMADRVGSMTRRVGATKDVALIGGVARNVGFVEAVKRNLEMDIVLPEDPDFVGAIGASIIGAQRAGGN